MYYTSPVNLQHSSYNHVYRQSGKQCGFWQDGFIRSKLIWINSVFKKDKSGLSRTRLKNNFSGFLPAILGKGPWPKLGKMIDLSSTLGEINDIEHNKGSKIYPQNLVILDCVMPSIPLKLKCLSIILTWVIVSHK